MDIKLWHYILAIALIGVMDFAWISVHMEHFFITHLKRSSLGYGRNPKPRRWMAAVVWPILGAGLVFFSVSRLSPDDSLLTVIFTGAAYGVAVNVFYAATNFAVIENYSLAVACSDGGWGTFMPAVVTTVVWLLAK